MAAAPIPPPAGDAERAHELTTELRLALVNEDEARLHHLLGGLLREPGLARGQRTAQQMRVLLDLLHSLRAAALNDEVTGLYSRGGFVQTASRFLNVAASDARPAHLIYFELEDIASRTGSIPVTALEVRARRMSRFMRELCPDYAAYDVLGRLGASEFAALTMSADPLLASRDAILLRARGAQGGRCISELCPRIGLARFDPDRPLAIEELLESAQRALTEPGDVGRSAASFEPGSTLSARAGGSPDRGARSGGMPDVSSEIFSQVGHGTKDGDGVRDDPRAREAAPQYYSGENRVKR
jgi:GGDEF domain-containing protein